MSCPGRPCSSFCVLSLSSLGECFLENSDVLLSNQDTLASSPHSRAPLWSLDPKQVRISDSLPQNWFSQLHPPISRAQSLLDLLGAVLSLLPGFCPSSLEELVQDIVMQNAFRSICISSSGPHALHPCCQPFSEKSSAEVRRLLRRDAWVAESREAHLILPMVSAPSMGLLCTWPVLGFTTQSQASPRTGSRPPGT